MSMEELERLFALYAFTKEAGVGNAVSKLVGGAAIGTGGALYAAGKLIPKAQQHILDEMPKEAGIGEAAKGIGGVVIEAGKGIAKWLGRTGAVTGKNLGGQIALGAGTVALAAGAGKATQAVGGALGHHSTTTPLYQYSGIKPSAGVSDHGYAQPF